MVCRAAFIAFFAACCFGSASRLLAAALLVWGAATALSRALLGRHYLVRCPCRFCGTAGAYLLGRPTANARLLAVCGSSHTKPGSIAG